MDDATTRQDAVRGLEAAFGEVLGEFRRAIAAAASTVSPGMLPGTYKVLTIIDRTSPVTLSSLAERLHADKGQLSRNVSELEELGLVERTPDPADGRIKLIATTGLGRARLAEARVPYSGRLAEVLEEWPIEAIERLTELLRALVAGEKPAS